MKKLNNADVLMTILAIGVAFIVMIAGVGVAMACEGAARKQSQRPVSATQANDDGSVSESFAEQPHVCWLSDDDAQHDARVSAPDSTRMRPDRPSIGRLSQD